MWSIVQEPPYYTLFHSLPILPHCKSQISFSAPYLGESQTARRGPPGDPAGYFKITSFFLSIYVFFPAVTRLLGHAVAQLVEALHYKPEGRGFDFPMVSLDFFHRHNPSCRTMALESTQPLKNEYQECFLGVKAAGA